MARRKLIVILILVLLFLLIWAYTSVFRISANIYEIDPGKFYRSAQLAPWELSELMKEKKIKTVINLRGNSGEFQWEKPMVESFGAHYYSIGMSSAEVPHREALTEYLSVIEFAARPILVHCRTGADRTGEATAVYAIEFMGETPEQALRHLSPKYWHIDFLNPGKKYFINSWRSSRWAWLEYDPCDPEYRNYFLQDKNCTPFAIVDCCSQDTLAPILNFLQKNNYSDFYRALKSVYMCDEKPTSFVAVPYSVPLIFSLKKWAQCSKMPSDSN